MTRIKIFKHGAHAQRTPLSYLALAPLFEDFIELVDRPGRADIYVFAHSLDVEAAPREMVEDWRRRRRPVVILSEEPFWDTLWGRRPLARKRVLHSKHGALPVLQLNHHTSSIFRFDHIPYYLLTDHRFANTYSARFARNALLSPAEWQAEFAARTTDLSFMFERRPEDFHNICWPEGGIVGLCAWRTAVAEACTKGRVERLGASWQSGPRRFELGNWYLDKMVRLDRRARMLAAFENTHQPNYITEKIFDAFACGSLPLYFAGPEHRIHEFGLPNAAWVNLFGLEVADASSRIEGLGFPLEFFDAYAEAQRSLEQLFCSTGVWISERQRLRHALLGELTAVLDCFAPGEHL